jgi:hypothetical protein
MTMSNVLPIDTPAALEATGASGFGTANGCDSWTSIAAADELGAAAASAWSRPTTADDFIVIPSKPFWLGVRGSGCHCPVKDGVSRDSRVRRDARKVTMHHGMQEQKAGLTPAFASAESSFHYDLISRSGFQTSRVRACHRWLRRGPGPQRW